MIMLRRVRSITEMRQVWMIRKEVFVKEQNVPIELEMDEADGVALHVIAYLDDEVAGTGRIFEDYIDSDRAILGRVAVLPRMRRRGVASAIIRELLEYACEKLYRKVVLHSQLKVVDIYKEFGFKITGDPFEEAGIMHVEMELDLLLPISSDMSLVRGDMLGGGVL